MTKAPEFIYYVAASVDGFIADAGGGTAWLNPFFDVDYGFRKFTGSVDCVVLGRRTYEQALAARQPPALGKRTVVLSRTRASGEYADEFWAESVESLAAHLCAEARRRVWVMGGGLTAASFLEAGLLHEVRLFIIPVVLGGGVPLFSTPGVNARLDLQETRSYRNGVIEARYRPLRSTP